MSRRALLMNITDRPEVVCIRVANMLSINDMQKITDLLFSLTSAFLAMLVDDREEF